MRIRQTFRRVLTALTLAFGLAVMHGGIGQAVACTGTNNMLMSSTPAMAAMPMAKPRAAEHAQHDQPVDQPPAAKHAQMCASTPASYGQGGGPITFPPLAALSPFTTRPLTLVLSSVSARGREPPAPDLVSELCVIRI